MAGNNGEFARRARAIWAYSPYQQKPLAEAAGIDPQDFKDWMGKTRPAEPSLEELVRLAKVAGVPRQFAERGFEGLWSADEEVRQDVDRLQERLKAVEEALIASLAGEDAAAALARLRQRVGELSPPAPPAPKTAPAKSRRNAS